MTNELYHYGILGMKWGVRRTPEQLGHVRDIHSNVSKISENATKLISDRGPRKKNASYRDPSTMDDNELRQRLNRLQMERQYKALTTPELTNGAKKVKDVLEIVGALSAIGASTVGIAVSVKQLNKR